MRTTRRRTIALLWLVQLLLLAGWSGIAFHQHLDGDAGHSCTVCNAAHTSAVPSVTTAVPAPRLVENRGVVAAVADDPLEAHRGSRHSRAPPLS